MRTNLIQSYLDKNNIPQNNAPKDFDVHKELANRTFIKPLPSNGKLVRTGLFDIPATVWGDIKYDYKAFKHAVRGKANDHELGRLNDVGMKIGGLAIASYLLTRRQTPTKKLFEFIGLATFFGAMDVWPKLFLQLPAYLIHGVNIRQQYIDNEGKKKMFYQDHQFIPWDLYSDKEINKIGDRMGVPKDIPNRRDYIQEKMRKIALQNNTMWMLTAGFATPVLSALMCNALEKPVLRYIDGQMNIKADNLMKNFNEEVKKYDFSANEKELDKLLKTHNGKPISPELFEAIVNNISDGLDPVTTSSIRKDLEIMLKPDRAHVLSDETLGNIHKAISAHFSKLGLSQEELDQIIPDVETLKQEFTNKNMMNGSMEEFSEATKVIQNLMEGKINNFLGDDKSIKAKKIRLQFRTLGSSLQHGKDTALQEAFKTQSAATITDDIAKSLKEISTILNSVKAKCKVFDEFAYIKVAQSQETVLANSWNEISESLMKALKFTPKEIETAKYDRELSSKILRNKLETIAADKEAFGNFIEEFGRVFSEFEVKMNSLLNTDYREGDLYHRNVIATFNDSSAQLKSKNMQRTATSLAGHDVWGETSLKHLYMNFVTDRIKSVKYSFYRLLDTASLYYRISQGYKLDDILPSTMCREVKEEAVELAKVTLLEGHTSDTAVKLFQNRYLDPDKNDLSQIEIDDKGQVKNKYFGKRPIKELVEKSNDNEYFDRVMKLMFDGEIHPDIAEKLKNPSLLEDFMRYREDALKFIGGDKYFAKMYHLVNGQEHQSSSLFKFILMGCSPDEMFNKLFNNTYNSKKWFSMVGKLGAGLIGVTLISQFFFGKTKDLKKTQEAK